MNNRFNELNTNKQHTDTYSQLTIPALQRGSACVVCGAPADQFCARCGLTPYCSGRCQRRDWTERHRACCHNLARLAGKKVDNDSADQTVAEKDALPQAPPLRRPHSPAKSARKDDDGVPDLCGPKKPIQTNAPNKLLDPRNRGSRNFNNNNSFYNKNKPAENRQGQDRKPAKQDIQEEKEDWGNRNTKPAAAITTQPATEPAKPPPSKPAEPAFAPQLKLRQPAEAPKAPKAPGSLTDAMPAKGGKKLVPKNYLLELLSVGDTALLSAESERDGALVCLSMHERYESHYQRLCEQYTVDCESETDTVTPAPGDTFSYLNPSDGGWYRARRLSPSEAALLDAGRVVPLRADDRLKALPAQYEDAPEFSCLLAADGVKVGDNLTCKLVSKTAEGFKVSLSSVESGAAVGEGEVSRWLPRVEHPAPAPVSAPAPVAPPGPPAIPEVPRPDVANNSKVLLVDATAIDRAFVRPADPASQRKFDQTLEDVVMYAGTATPLKDPPAKGQVVIGKFTDGLFYRALVKRTNVKQNKYLLEYIEFGNLEVTQLENIYPCPQDLQLSSRPTEATMVTLQCNCPNTLTGDANEYLDALKDGMAELTLTIPSGASTAASGSAVCLTEVKKNESVNRKLEQMCTPEWKKLEEKGADVVELKPIMYSEMENLELPEDVGRFDLLDVSTLADGLVSGCPSDLPHQRHVLTTLTEQMAEYCNSDIGKEPYLPKSQELCIAQCPPYPQWFRAALLEQSPGSATAQAYFVDYGNVAEVPVRLMRKMLPEFVRGLPALASLLEIKGFPTNPSPEQLARAVEHMQITEDGRGTLTVTRCEKNDAGLYLVHAPELIKAMGQ